MNLILGWIGRVIFWLTALYIIGSAVLNSFLEGDLILAILEVVFFPLTYFYYPFVSGKVLILIISILGYIVSTVIGKMKPVE